MLVCLGRHKNAIHGWFQQQKFVLSQFWRLESLRSRFCNVDFLPGAFLSACRWPPSGSVLIGPFYV